jgi:hypothetical protein
MKKIVTLAIICSFILTISSCKKDDTTTTTTPAKPTVTGVSVTITKLASETGNVECNGLSVELYSNATYTNKIKSTVSGGSATAGTASFGSVPNGKYYLIAWKDKDNDNVFSVGDYFGFFETPIILDGTARNFAIQMYILK